MSITKRYAAANPRYSSFKKLLDSDIKYLTSIGGKSLVATDSNADAIQNYNTDWLRQIEGQTPLVLFPEKTEHVAAMLEYCQREKIAVVPQGGNTGLVYGSVPVHDEVVISTQRMVSPKAIHPETFSTTVGAGVILRDIQVEAAKKNLLFPLDMGSKGSAQVGGCISTNAGGIHFARYGSIRSNIIGLEAVTASGKIISTMTRYENAEKPYSERASRSVRAVRKDNVGYDLKQLFCGSEGTLGMVTKAEVRLHPAPASNTVLLIHLTTIESVLQLFQLAKEFLGDGLLSAFEVMDTAGLAASFFDAKGASTGDSFLVSGVPDASAIHPGFVVLLEAQGPNPDTDSARLIEFIEMINSDSTSGTDAKSEMLQRVGFPGASCIVDQVLADTGDKRNKVWGYREDLPVKLASSGVILKCDVCFPFDKFYYPVSYARQEALKDILKIDITSSSVSDADKRKAEQFLREELVVTGYGHFGDGNVHLNIVDVTPDKRHATYLLQTLAPRIYEHCAQDEGSISAEHGIGLQKKKYLRLNRSREWYEVMKGIKQFMDPNGILSPYKMFAE